MFFFFPWVVVIDSRGMLGVWYCRLVSDEESKEIHIYRYIDCIRTPGSRRCSPPQSLNHTA